MYLNCTGPFIGRTFSVINIIVLHHLKLVEAWLNLWLQNLGYARNYGNTGQSPCPLGSQVLMKEAGFKQRNLEYTVNKKWY